MPAQTHARGADATVARRESDQAVDTQRSVFVVRGELFLNLPRVAGVGARTVIGESFRTRELMVAAGCGDDVAVAGDLAGKALHGTGHCKKG